jgi:Raf kinase inhibitor-like YbhB/YbcL family protein
MPAGMTRRLLSYVLSLSCVCAVACGDDADGASDGGAGSGADSGPPDTGTPEAVPLAYTGDFTMGETIPAKHKCPMSVFGTGMGDNISPALEWRGGPNETQSFAVVLFDTRYNYFHWAIWDIGADVTELPEGIPAGFEVAEPEGAHQRGGTPSQFNEYFGPCSDAGAMAGVYEYRLYALSAATLELPMDVQPAALQAAIDGATLEMTAWSGTPE